MVSLGIVRPIVGGRQLLSWLLIGWIGMFALAPVQIEVTARSFAHPAVHLVAADDAGFGPFEQAVHVRECASATCSLWAARLMKMAPASGRWTLNAHRVAPRRSAYSFASRATPTGAQPLSHIVRSGFLTSRCSRQTSWARDG